MQENRQHTHKNVTQDIAWETSLRKKPSLQKHPSPCIIQQKIPFKYNHESLQSHSHYQEIHMNKHESTHHMPCFQPSQMLPCLTYQALSHSTLSFFPFVFSHQQLPLWLLIFQQVPQITKWYYINHVLKPYAN